MRNKIKKYINNNIYSSSTITKIEQNINYNNPEELYFFGKYLFLYLKNFPDSEISKKTEHYLHEAYYNWKNRNTKLYANLNKLITQFYLKYNKFNDANTFLLNYFNTVGEKNIKEAWPWRYRFKIFYETKIYFIYKKPEKFLKWLENAYKIEKKNGSNHISLNIYKDFQKNLNKKFKSEEDNFYNKIQNLNFIFLKKLERKESAYIEGEYTFSNKKTSAEKDSKTEIQHDKLKRKKYKKKLNKLNYQIKQKNKKIENLENKLNTVKTKKEEKDFNLQKLEKQIQKLKRKNVKLKKEKEDYAKKSNKLKSRLVAESQEKDIEPETKLDEIIIKRIGIIGDAKIKDREIKGIIKTKLKNHDIDPPQKKNIEILASEYIKSKKTSLKSKIDNNTYNWLIIGAHPHKIKNFPNGIENYIDSAIEGGWCSLKYTQCTSTNGNLDNIAKSNLKRAVDELINREKTEL